MTQSTTAKMAHGATALVQEAESMLNKAISEKGGNAAISFPNTIYYLPVIFGITGKAVEKINDLQPVLKKARQMLRPVTAKKGQTTNRRKASGSGMAALLAAETIEGLRFVYGLQPETMGGFRLAGGQEDHLNGPIDDLQQRSWGIQLMDGRMPGVALITGCAKSTAAAVEMVKELRRRNALCLLSGNVNGRSIIHQLNEAGMKLGYEAGIVPLGTDTISTVYAFGFVTRCALMLGGYKPGMSGEILRYSKNRLKGFVLALGELDEAMVTMAEGANAFGFSVITDTSIPKGIRANKNIVSVPFESIEGADDQEKADRLLQSCMEVRCVKAKVSRVDLPVAYGCAYEGETIKDADLRVEFGGPNARAFQLLQMAKLDEVTDGKIDVIGRDFSKAETQAAMDLGIVVKMAGRKMQGDFESLLERRIHEFISGANGIEHIGARDRMRIRVSKTTSDRGFSLSSFGKILHTRFHEEFGAIAKKVEVMIITEPKLHREWLEKAHAAYDLRDKRLAELTDDTVDEFYSCTLCQSFSPNQVCLISPERISPCGAHNWLDCRASFIINPSGPHQPIKLGKQLDAHKGVWAGLNKYIKVNSHGAVKEVSMYSMMENPVSTCGSFECIVMLIPEANGVMVVSQEDASMTPAGMNFPALAGIAQGGMQTPGVMGVGKSYLISPKFISADGGFKRIVWMSSALKESMANKLKAACEREGEPDLMDKIADERQVISAQELVHWLKEHRHPAIEMEKMF